MTKKVKNIYSLDGLILKKKDLQVIKIINMLRLFSNLRFFTDEYYPYDYSMFLKFYNDLVKYIIMYSFLGYLKKINVMLKTFFKKKSLPGIRFKIKYFLK